MRLRPLVALVVVTAITGLVACTSDDGGDAADTTTTDAPTTTVAPEPVEPLPALRALRGDDARIVDEQGRQVILRGVNVNSLGDYHQGDPEAEPVVPVTEADWRDMSELGFNVVRLLVSWSRLQPERDRYDDDYIEEIAAAIDAAHAVGMYTVVDMHQDAWGKYIASAPDETCPEGGEPAIGWDGAPEWATLTDGASTCRTSSRESAPAVGAAWDNFYEDTEGIQTELVKTWAHLVEGLGDRTSIAGYDLLNEPGNGTDQSVSLPALGGFYDRAITAIRAAESATGVADGGRIAFFETSVTGLPVAPGFTDDGNLVFAPHNYGESIGPIPIEGTFDYFQTLADGYRTALWIGEYGFFEDTDVATEKLTRYAAKEDALVTAGGTWWQWRQACGDPHSVNTPGGTADPVQIHLRTNGCPGDVDGGVNPRWRCLWRPYPRATPGRVVSLEAECDRRLDYRGSTDEPGTIEVWFPGDEEPEVEVEQVTDVQIEPVDGGFVVTGEATGEYHLAATIG